MYHQFKIVVVIVLNSFVFSAVYGSYKQAEKIIRSQLGNKVHAEYSTLIVTETVAKEMDKQIQQQCSTDSILYWKIHHSDSLLSLALMDRIKGKSAVITVLVIFDSQQKIHSVNILKYQGKWGREITKKKWLKQFDGKSSVSDFLLNRDIEGISGATFSAQSVVSSIQRLTSLAEFIFRNIPKLNNMKGKS